MNDKKQESNAEMHLQTKIDSLAYRYLELGRFSGSILIANNDSIIFNSSYGLADYNSNRPFIQNTAFKIGHLSELFTEAIIGEMLADSTIELHTKVSTYIPAISANYTINDLLSHQSGLPSIQSIKKSNPALETKYSTIGYANTAIVDAGNKSIKSDLEYNILGVVIEKMNGLNFQDAINKYASSWGLENTYFYRKATYNEAKGYLFNNYRGKGLELQESSSFNNDEAFSSMGIKSTAKDLLVLTQKLSNKKIKWDGYIENDGFSYSLDKDGETGLTIIILSNRRHPVASEMSHSIKAIIENKPYEIPLARKQIAIDTDLFKEYAGQYALNENMSINVFSANDSLFVMMGPTKVHLKPQSENQFYMDENDASIKFIKDSTNTVLKAILSDGFLNGNEIEKVRQ